MSARKLTVDGPALEASEGQQGNRNDLAWQMAEAEADKSQMVGKKLHARLPNANGQFESRTFENVSTYDDGVKLLYEHFRSLPIRMLKKLSAQYPALVHA